MEPAPNVEWVFFPLDEQLGLTSSSLTPRTEEHLVHLATWMPFARAAAMLSSLVGVQVSEATVRRHTEHAGAVCETLQNEQCQQPVTTEPRREEVPRRFVLSADGAFVPLVRGAWAEVRTLAIGEVIATQEHTKTSNISYFSRMTDAANFEELVEGEMKRRQLLHASEVAGVMDGADWLQGLLDLHCPDALRILDFPHAAQRVSAILETLQQAGQIFPSDANARCLHLLKHAGPRPVFRWLRYLTRGQTEVGQVRENLAYLHKREAFMQYPQYQAQGWPIGSGMVESAHKLVMQARLKGPGMHWEGSHVNPMLALRTTVCNDRWLETWERISSHMLHQRRQKCLSRTTRRQQQATFSFLLAWMRFLRPVPKAPFPVSAPQPPARIAGRPTASHPWKRVPACLPKASAKN